MENLEITFTFEFTSPEAEKIFAACRDKKQIVSHWAKEALLKEAAAAPTYTEQTGQRKNQANLVYYLVEELRKIDRTRTERLECQYSIVLEQMKDGTLEDWEHVEALLDDLIYDLLGMRRR